MSSISFSRRVPSKCLAAFSLILAAIIALAITIATAHLALASESTPTPASGNTAERVGNGPVQDDDFTYAVKTADTVEVAEYIGAIPTTGTLTITIPSTVNYQGTTYTVVGIGDWGIFAGITNLEKATIPNTVTYIGRKCFEGCTGLKEVVIPASVTSIGYRCFADCSSLQSITLPGSIRTIDAEAFTFNSNATSYLKDLYFAGTKAQWNSVSRYPSSIVETKTTVHWHCTITFDANGHGTAPTARTAWSKCTTTAPDGDYADGLFILGWSRQADGSGVWNFETDLVPDDMTLYAIWGLALIDDIPVSNGGYVYVGGIRWRVIGVKSDRWLLISADVLGSNMNWSAANDYCGTVYSSSFSGLEKGAVLGTTKQDITYGYYEAADLSDVKLFLLSASEAMTYFVSEKDRKPGEWWLRSPYVSGPRAGLVAESGYVTFCEADDPRYLFGSRPAFQLKLASVLFTSAAAGGKPTAGSGFSAYVVPTTAVDRKLTLLDSSRSAFAARAIKNTVAPGDTLAVTYSGAKTGMGEVVSAMLCNSSGVPLYYASLTSAGSGSWNLTIPSGLAGGSYTLKVFNEQQNGNNSTDYASAPVEIGLTVNSVAATYTVTYKVVNGQWSDNTTADKTESVEEGHSPTNVPSGMVPNQGYEGGAWDTNPTGVAITQNKTFTYSFDAVPPAPVQKQAIELAGTNRYVTMARIVDEAFDSSDYVIVASGENFPDALAAASLAGLLDCPVVLTTGKALDANAASTISGLGATKAVIVGGDGAVSNAAAASVAGLVGSDPVRLAGKDRYATMLAIYGHGDIDAPDWGSTAIIATGKDYPDTLSIAGWAFASRSPIFLCDPKTGLTADTKAALSGGGFDRIVIVGGTGVVPVSAEGFAKSVVGDDNIERLGGANRYATSRLIAEFVLRNGGSADKAAIATGKNFPDALAGSALVGRNRSILLLADPGSSTALDVLAANKDSIQTIYYLGGEGVVPKAVRTYAENAIGME